MQIILNFIQFLVFYSLLSKKVLISTLYFWHIINKLSKETPTFRLGLSSWEIKPQLISNFSANSSCVSWALSLTFLIFLNGEIDQGRFTTNNGKLSAIFGGWYLCDNTNYQVYIFDANGTKSDNFSFQYIYTCFLAGTKILTKFGYKNIEDIKINDIVYSFNEKINKVELNTVVKTFIHEDTEIYEIYINDEIIKVTPHHRFYVERNNKFEWIEVKDILLTDKLFCNENKLITINKIEHKKETNVVYNFEVQNNHTYFVSNKNILVHNAKSPC